MKVAGTLTRLSDAADAFAGSAVVVNTKTAAYTETTTTNHVINLLNLTAGFTVTLPTAVGFTGKLGYKKMLAAGQMTIATTGGQTIDGGATAVLNNQWEAITLVSDNANWVII